MCFLQLFTDCQGKIRITSAHFYKCFKVILLFYFIQIFFIYKWHVRNFNVSFLVYDVTIQYHGYRD